MMVTWIMYFIWVYFLKFKYNKSDVLFMQTFYRNQKNWFSDLWLQAKGLADQSLLVACGTFWLAEVTWTDIDEQNSLIIFFTSITKRRCF